MPFNMYNFNPRAFGQDFSQPDPNSPFSLLRQKSIFSPPETPDDQTKRFLSQVNPPPKADFSQPSSTPPDNSMQYDPTENYKEMKRLLTSRGPALSAYQSALQEQPTDDNVPVSNTRKIMGTLAGIAGGFAKGPEAGVTSANEIIDSPYKTAMRDYSVKMKNLGESAKMEQDDRDAQVKMLDYADKMKLDYAKFNQTERQRINEELDKKANREMTQGKNETDAAYKNRMAAVAEANSKTSATAQSDLAGYHKGQLAIGGRTAATGEKNASTAAANEQSEAAFRTGSLAARNKSLDIRDKQGKTTSPTQQAYAVDNALRELASDPRFKNFIETNKVNGTHELGVDDGSLMYQEFKRRVKKLAETSIKMSTPFDDEVTDPNATVTIGKPRQ